MLLYVICMGTGATAQGLCRVVELCLEEGELMLQDVEGIQAVSLLGHGATVPVAS